MKCSKLVIDIYVDDDWKQFAYVSYLQTVDSIGALFDYVLTIFGVEHEISIENLD